MKAANLNAPQSVSLHASQGKVIWSRACPVTPVESAFPPTPYSNRTTIYS